MLDFSYGQAEEDDDHDSGRPNRPNGGAGHRGLLAIEDGDADSVDLPSRILKRKLTLPVLKPSPLMKSPWTVNPPMERPLTLCPNSWNGIDLSGVPSGEGIKLMEPETQEFEDDIPASQPGSPEFEDPVMDKPMDEAPVPPESGAPDGKMQMFAVPAPVSPDRVKRKRELLMARMEQLRLGI